MTHWENDSTRLTHDFDPTKEESFTSAHAEYKELRAKCPVAHSHAYKGFWAVFKYDDIVNILKDFNTFTTSVQNTVPKFAFTGRRPPLHLDPPEHTPYRRIINRFFTNEKMEKLAPVVEKYAIELLEPLVEKREFNFSTEYAHKYPAYIFAEFFNVPKELSLTIREISAVYVKAIQEMNDEVVKKYSRELYGIAQSIIDERRQNPMDPDEDITTALLEAQDKGELIEEDLVLGCVRQLLLTGMVAPSVFLASMVAHLAQHEEIQNQLRQDLSLIPAATEEYLRLLTPYRGMARTPKRDVVIGGRLIKKDEPIALVYMSANRDESVFSDPDQFILNRPNIDKHIAFGRGPHQCPGAPLARMMIGDTLRELLKRTKTISINGEIKMTKWAEWGVLSLPLKVTPI